jgi:nitroreductase/NAD-dependent dihydropyrimidine dehydrogenase PreA subunit
MINFNYDDCVNCLSCSKACPIKAIGVRKGRVEFLREGNCISCGHCISVCPAGAVSGDFKDSLPGKDIKSLDISGFNQVEDFMLSRRSIRAYDGREVEREKLEKVLRLAAHAPTGSNRQNARFYVVGPKGTEELERLAKEYFTNQPENKIGQVMKEDNYRVLLGTPVTIGLYSKKGEGVWSCALAAQNLVLAAHSLGLGTCYNGIFTGAYYNYEPIREYFDLGDEYEMHMFISLGYPDLRVKYRHTIERKEASVIWKD